MNPYALSGTAPSRRRVYLFHHLGDPLYITVFEVVCNNALVGAQRAGHRTPADRLSLSVLRIGDDQRPQQGDDPLAQRNGRLPIALRVVAA